MQEKQNISSQNKIPDPENKETHIPYEMEISLETMQILERIKAEGGKPLIIGGSVRDHLQNITAKDIDVEVYQLPAEKLVSVLSEFGKVDSVGVSFGVIKLTMPDGEDYDFSLPRRENKTGKGHKGFIVEPDPSMTVKEAALRRDFTWNAVAYDPFKKELIDYFGGRNDLKNKLLRHTNEKTFAEDPLRVLRGFQFSGRMGLTSTPETIELSKTLKPEFKELAIERVWVEWEKWAKKSQYPSKGINFLTQTEWIEFFPDLNINESILESLDNTIRIPKKSSEKATYLLTTLCSNLSSEQAQSFMKSIGAPKNTTKYISKLVSQINFKDDSDKGIRQLSVDLAPATIEDLAWVLQSMHGKDSVDTLRNKAKSLGLFTKQFRPLLNGKFLKEIGIKPGPQMGRLLKDAFNAQISGEFDSLEGAKKWVQKNQK